MDMNFNYVACTVKHFVTICLEKCYGTKDCNLRCTQGFSGNSGVAGWS